MRINQYVAQASGISRRQADAAITAGRVTVDGRPASLGEAIAQDAAVALDGHTLHPLTTHHYLLFHKPAGYVTSRVRQGDDPHIYELLPAEWQRLRPAGRLDRDSSGLLILTDDGPFIQTMTHPSSGKRKVYELVLTKPLTAADRRHLEAGVELTDGPSRLHVEAANGAEVTVSLGEGRNRQIRRTLGALGYGIRRLHRTAIGPYEIGSLAAGQWQEFKL
jgi:23S rRNA pseudouridine2605 synthase